MQKNKPVAVSIIVPCYNVADYLPRCLDSLLCQTISNIEIICVDDKSTDNSLAILQRYAAQDARILVVALDNNCGVSVARNKGLEIAHGEYVAFVDPDDYVDSGFYKALYQKAIVSDLQIVKGGVLCHVGTDVFVHPATDKVKKNKVYFSSTFWSAIYRRDFIMDNDINFPAGVITAQDIVFLCNAVIYACNIAVVDNVFYHYTVNRDGGLDSAYLSDDKAKSKYNAFYMNLTTIETFVGKKYEIKSLVLHHVFYHVMHTLTKTFESEALKKQLFELASEAYKKYRLKKYIKNDYNSYVLHALNKCDYRYYKNHISGKTRKAYLFGVFYLFNIDSFAKYTYVKLFGTITLMKLKNRQ